MAQQPKYRGVTEVINGNGAVARVMAMVCGGVIGYPITPSTEISETFEATLAQGKKNIWGKHPFFFEPEGEHSAQSGAMGAALTGGKYISNASSSQGILYGLESHYVSVGKRIGGFVLHVAARSVSRHSLNVMGGHDDVYSLLPAGYTILFGSNPEEAADFAAISYRVASLSLTPVANCMDGFSTSHMMSEARVPSPHLLKEYLGDPTDYIPCPTPAQRILFGAKGRVAQMKRYCELHAQDCELSQRSAIQQFLDGIADPACRPDPDSPMSMCESAAQTHAFSDPDIKNPTPESETAQSYRDYCTARTPAERCAAIESDCEGVLFDIFLAPLLPADKREAWRRQWIYAPAKNTRLRVPALVDVDNPGLTGPVQNQPDFQAGIADDHTHFKADVPALVSQAIREYNQLTGRNYAPVQTYNTEDADYIFIGLGSITEDVQAVMPYLRAQGINVGLVQIHLLQPFPEAELVRALKGAQACTVLERSNQAALREFVHTALLKATQNSRSERYCGIPALTSDEVPLLSTGFFGLGGHDVQPRDLIAAAQAMADGTLPAEFYLGTQFFDDTARGEQAELQEELRTAYPATQKMALQVKNNPPDLLPADAMRIRFHSVGGYGTIATGKLLTDILAELLHMHSKAAPKYGSEKSGAPTNYYITLSPEPIKITNASLEEVEIVISPDHKVFSHTNPLAGLGEGGTFIIQSSLTPEEFWNQLPLKARQTIRERHIRLFILDAFRVAKEHAPNESLEIRMMGVAFIGAIVAHVDRISTGANIGALFERVHRQLEKKFGMKGAGIVDANMAVVEEGAQQARQVRYERFPEDSSASALTVRSSAQLPLYDVRLSACMACQRTCPTAQGLFDSDYFNATTADPFAREAIAEAPVYPGAGFFMPPASAAFKDKGLFRLHVPVYHADVCTGCMECALVCPDAAIPNTVFSLDTLLSTACNEAGSCAEPLHEHLGAVARALRDALLSQKGKVHPSVADTFTQVARGAVLESADSCAGTDAGTESSGDTPAGNNDQLGDAIEAVAAQLRRYPAARTRPFFDAAEKKTSGSGVLFSATIDPWKCTGCLECVSVCPPHALIANDQTDEIRRMSEERFSFLTKLPNSPAEFSDPNSAKIPDLKRVLLDHNNYYSVTGGHGACRGCAEVTAIRQTMALAHHMHQRRTSEHRNELARLVRELHDFSASPEASHDERLSTILGHATATLEHRLYRYENGSGGRGPAGTVIANATGCSSVYASTMPYNAYQDPWVNGLFQDAQPLAKGLFEGLAADLSTDVLALRQARAILAGKHFSEIPTDPPEWKHFTEKELRLMPTVLTIGGDGATYDIGFGALSRVLASGTPVKMLVLDTGAYSNTGGQASTASPVGQDSDLSRYGTYHSGKTEQRKELGILAAMHPNVMVVCTSTSYQAHFLKYVNAALEQTDYPALIDAYTPCQPENGIGDHEAAEHAKLAVKSRMNPLFVHEPQHENISDRFIIAGNPNPKDTWSSIRLSYIDDSGKKATQAIPYTPADFAATELRFRKHFSPLPADAEHPVPIADYVELSSSERADCTPFIYMVNQHDMLIKKQVSPEMVLLTEQCRDYWHLLQYMAGQNTEEK